MNNKLKEVLYYGLKIIMTLVAGIVVIGLCWYIFMPKKDDVIIDPSAEFDSSENKDEVNQDTLDSGLRRAGELFNNIRNLGQKK